MYFPSTPLPCLLSCSAFLRRTWLDSNKEDVKFFGPFLWRRANREQMETANSGLPLKCGVFTAAASKERNPWIVKPAASSRGRGIFLIMSVCNYSLACILFQFNTQLFSTRRMAMANGTCVSFCNQPKAQFGYLRRVTPVCRCLHLFCRWRHLATSRESKAHFGIPWVCNWDNRSKCYMDGKRIQCL